MGRWRVADVMTGDVASVRETASFKEIVDILAERRVSAVPVVDAANRVVGVVSEADLLHKVELAGRRGGYVAEGWRRRIARGKAGAGDAHDLMTTPAVTTGPAASIVEAARSMEYAQVKRLPVVDGSGQLVGVVARSDLLKVFLQSDAAIGREVEQAVLRQVLWTGPPEVVVEVDQGVVTLVGELECKSLVGIAIRLTTAVEGVVGVVDRLTYGRDDTDRSDAHPRVQIAG